MLNKIILVGRVGKIDVSNLRTFDSGKTKFSFSVATTMSWYSKKENEYKNDTTWHNVEVWDKTAEYCAKNVKTGDLMCVEGSMKITTYEEKKYYTVMAQKVYRLSKTEADNQGADKKLFDFFEGKAN